MSVSIVIVAPMPAGISADVCPDQESPGLTSPSGSSKKLVASVAETAASASGVSVPASVNPVGRARGSIANVKLMPDRSGPPAPGMASVMVVESTTVRISTTSLATLTTVSVW